MGEQSACYSSGLGGFHRSIQHHILRNMVCGAQSRQTLQWEPGPDFRAAVYAQEDSTSLLPQFKAAHSSHRLIHTGVPALPGGSVPEKAPCPGALLWLCGKDQDQQYNTQSPQNRIILPYCVRWSAGLMGLPPVPSPPFLRHPGCSGGSLLPPCEALVLEWTRCLSGLAFLHHPNVHSTEFWT